MQSEVHKIIVSSHLIHKYVKSAHKYIRYIR